MSARADRTTPASVGAALSERVAHVLVVEDYEPLRWLAREYLESLGYQVTVAADARAGLAHLERGGLCDVVFTDLTMPGALDGRELIEHARRLRTGLAAVLTSGNDAPSLRTHVPVDVQLLMKPYRLDSLDDAISSALGR